MGKQTFPVSIEFIANISQLQRQIKQVTGEIERMGSTSSGAQLQTQFNNLTKSLTDLQTRAQQPITSAAEFSRLEGDLNKVEQGYLSLLQIIERMKGASDAKKLELLPADQQSRIKQAEAALKQYESATKSALSGSKDFLRAQEQVAKQGGIKSAATAEMRKYKKALDEAEQEVKQLTERQQQLNTELEAAKTSRDSLQGKLNAANKREDTERAKQLTTQLEAAKSRVTELRGQLKGVESSLQSANGRVTSFTNQWSGAKAKVKEAEVLIEQANATMSQLGSGNTQQLQQAFEQLKAKAQELEVSLEGIDDVSSIEILKQRLQQLKTQGLEQVDAGLNKTSSNLRGKFGGSLNQTKAGLQQLRVEFDRFNSKLQEINQFKSYVTYFFSLTNSVYLFRAALQSAFETVKELDASMTQTAVVTNYSISDMWDKLPEYTKNASALGATTKELYDATTLYYQQGLKGQEVMDVGIETMKMARIASMDAAEATEAMTAALRGFNMEVDKANATRINDVYSELAAITAADTEQIATAMTKTASIAHNANMEFETTAALLAQIIETTQEAPETAGTAMKTIIARFSEVKQLQNRGENTGEDEEGESIDVNKIDKALKSVGISMKDYFAGTEGLDQILLKLAEKWEHLDFTTQRYIATMAAGSRQQSRFIAMMSDYKRTMQLVTAANNSAGASQKQFEKTLDSIDAKTNKLKNSWNQFVMGLANNEYIKGAIDLFTGLLDVINWLIERAAKIAGKLDGTSDGINNLTKSLLTLLTVYGAIRGGGFLLGKAFDGIIGGITTKKNAVEQEIKNKQGLTGQTNGAESLQTAGVEAGNSLKTGATQAGEAFKTATAQAAEIIKGAASTAAATETTGAAAENQVEISGEEAGQTISNTLEQEGALLNNAITLQGAAAKSEIEIKTAIMKRMIELGQGPGPGPGPGPILLPPPGAGTGGILPGSLLPMVIPQPGSNLPVPVAPQGSNLPVVYTGQRPMSPMPPNLPTQKGGKIGKFFSNHGQSIASFVGVIAAITLVVSAAEAFKKSVDESTYTVGEQLSALAAEEERLLETTNELSQELSNFGKKRNNLDGLIKSISTLKRGSAEWASTLHEIRTEMIDILSKYPKLRQYTQMQNGVRVFTEQGWEEYERALMADYFSSTKMLYMTQMSQVALEKAQSAEGLNLPTSTISQQEQESISSASSTGTLIGGAAGGIAGWIGGTALTAKALGAVGTAIAPGLGTIIGAILGLAIGGLIGWAVGGGNSADDGVAPELINKVGTYAYETEFSAQDVVGDPSTSETQITKFLNESGLDSGTEEFNQLFDYISNNAEEFDKHSNYLAEANSRLREFAYNLGLTRAQELGLEGEAAEAYAAVTEVLTAGSFEAMKRNELVKLLRESGKLQFNNEAIDLSKVAKGLVTEFFKYNKSGYKQEGNKIVYTDTGNAITESEFYSAIASGRTTEQVTKEADKVFEITSGNMTLFDWVINSENNTVGYNTQLDKLTGTNGLDLIQDGAKYLRGLKATSDFFGTTSGASVNPDDLAWWTYQKLWSEGTSAFDYDVDKEYIFENGWTINKTNTDIKGKEMITDGGRHNLFADKTEPALNPNGYTNADEWVNAHDYKDYQYYVLYDERNWYDYTKTGAGYTTDTLKQNMATLLPDWYGEGSFNPDMLYNLYLGGFADEIKQSVQAIIDYENKRRQYTETTYKEVSLDSSYNVVEGEEKKGYGLTFLKDVEFGQLQNFIDQFDKMAATYQQIETDWLANMLQGFHNTLKGLSSEQITKALNIITQVDFASISSLAQGRQQLVDLGVGEQTLEFYDGMNEELKEFGIALAKIDLDQVIKEIEDLNKVVKKINTAELGVELTFSEDEYNAMISGGAASSKDFVKTMDGFVYIGQSMDELRNTILKTNSILLQIQVDALRRKVGYATAVHTSGLENLNWGATSTWDSSRMKEFARGAVSNLGVEFIEGKDGYFKYKDVEYSYTDKEGAQLLTNLLHGSIVEGIDFETLENIWEGQWEDLAPSTQQGIKDFLSEVADGVLNEANYRDQLDTGLTGVKQETLSLMTGQEMIDMIGKADEQGNVYTKEDVDAVLAAQGKLEGTTVAGYELGQQIYQDTGGADLTTEQERNAAWEEAHRLGQALALDAARNQKEYTGLTKVFDVHASAVTKANRGTDAYRKGLSKIQTAMEDAYNIKLSEQFMLDHADLLERVLAGEDGAWEEWANLMTEQTAKGLNETESIVSGSMAALALDVNNIANTIDPNIGITSTFDPAGIIAAKIGLQTIGEDVVATQAQLDGLTSLYDILGATVEFETETKWIKDGVFVNSNIEGAQEVQVIKAVHVTNTGSGGLSDYSPPGGGGGGNSEPWENPYDEFYNTVEKINEELRKREKLELRYQRLLDRNAATAAEIARLTREQMASLRTERSDREGLLRGRERQMRDIESEYSDVSKYAWYNEEKGQIEIDWNLLEGLDGSTDEDLTSRVEEYISKLEEQQDLIEEEQDALQEIQDAIWELYEQGKDEYFDLEDQVKEAIIADRQKEIDKLSEINDSINDTNSKLLESMQEQLDEYRQNRDNEKTEEELSDKQRKLAYLQQDTSGANALEIMQLQEELDEATEDYTDTLIDQKISELQQQNDKAAEQRQQQIDIMQAQLDQYSESTAIWDEVNALMSDGLDPESGLIRGSRLEELLKSAEGFDGMSKLKKMDWLNELNNNVAQALAWLEGGALQNLFGEGGKVTFTDKDGNTVTGTINENGDVETDDGRIYSGDKFKIDQNGNIISYETEDEAKENWNTAQPPEETEDDWPSGLIKPSQIEGNVYSGMSGTKVKSVQTALKKLGYDTGTIDSKFGPKTKAAVKKFQKDAKTEGWNPDIGSPDGVVGPRTKLAFKNHPKQFKTGGLADFTGPAWLDGTKSKPEYVLNADQTKAFFTLVDVLGGLESKAFATPEKTGDNTYDIDINVESIGSDYDVEQLATTVKRLINEDARYRNNNTINLTR